MKLVTGVTDENRSADYINACFVNSPFKKDNYSETKVNGDRKLICA